MRFCFGPYEYDCFLSKNGIEHLEHMNDKFGHIPYTDQELDAFNDAKLARLIYEYTGKATSESIIFFVKKSVVVGKDICFLITLNKKAMTETMEKELLDGFYINENGNNLFEFTLKPEDEKKK